MATRDTWQMTNHRVGQFVLLQVKAVSEAFLAFVKCKPKAFL
jgi:hypothetical protein